jgi:hypothetical protein
MILPRGIAPVNELKEQSVKCCLVISDSRYRRDYPAASNRSSLRHGRASAPQEHRHPDRALRYVCRIVSLARDVAAFERAMLVKSVTSVFADMGSPGGITENPARRLLHSPAESGTHAIYSTQRRRLWHRRQHH